MTGLFAASNLRFEIKCVLQQLRLRFDDDCSAALLDSKGNLIDATLRHGLDLTSFDTLLKNSSRYISPSPGECLITNDPYSGSPRLSDLFFIYPAFQKNDLRFFVALRVSAPGLLNKDTTGVPKSVDDEGIRIPPTALDTKGQVKNAILDFISQKETRPQFESLFNKVESSLQWAAGQLLRLPIAENAGQIQKFTEGLIKNMLDSLPDGDYIAQEFLDDDGFEKGPIKIQAKISIHDKNVLINFAGTNKQTVGPYNCTYAMTLAASMWPFLSLIDAHIPINAGLFKFLTVEAPEGTIVNARTPAAYLGGYFETSQRVSDCVQLALSKALPQTIPALSGGSCNPTVVRFPNGKLWVDTLASGLGASSKGDGLSGLHPGLHNFTQASIEDIETAYPVRVVHHNLRLGSGGHGRYEGGHGLARGLQFLEPAKVWFLADRRVLKAHGLVGGTSGNPGETIIVSGGKRDKGPPYKRMIELKAGDMVIIDSPGGGGWGKLKSEKEDAE